MTPGTESHRREGRRSNCDPVPILRTARSLATMNCMEKTMAESLVPKRQYTEEFRAEAVRLAETINQHEASCSQGRRTDSDAGHW
jgi:hypothetical protein